MSRVRCWLHGHKFRLVERGWLIGSKFICTDCGATKSVR